MTRNKLKFESVTNNFSQSTYNLTLVSFDLLIQYKKNEKIWIMNILSLLKISYYITIT